MFQFSKFLFAISALILSGLLVGPLACGVDALPSDCTTDEECVEQTDGEYATCGNSEQDGLVCCKAGSTKCPCLEDDTCSEDLVCFQQDLGDDFPKGKFCGPAWTEAFDGLEPVK